VNRRDPVEGLPGHVAAPWREQVHRLEPHDLPLLPLKGKSPKHLGKGWQHKSFTAEQLLANWQGKADAIGSRSGEDAHGLLICDIDGQTAIDHCQAHGCDPLTAPTWRIERREAPDRLKVAWRVPQELWPLLQEAARRPGKERPQNLIREHQTRPGNKATKQKREAIEVSFGGRQMVIAGAHPDGGCYRWPENHGPEALAEIPPAWWGLVRAVVKPRERPAPAANAAGTPPPHRSAGPLPPRPPKAITDALAQVPPFDHGQGRRDELRDLAFRMHVDFGRDEALRLLQKHSPAVRDLASYFTTQPTEISDGSLWPFLREHYGIDISRHDLKGKRPTVEVEQAESVAGMPDHGGDSGARTSEQEEPPRVPSFQSLIQQLPEGWQQDENTGKQKPSGLSAGHLADLLPADALRFNEMSLRAEVHTRHGWQQINDADLDSAYVVLTGMGWRIGSEAVVMAVMHAARQAPHHPVRAYLQRVEADPAIVPFNLDQVAPQFFRASNPLHAAMVRAWLIGAAARALQPGCQMDYCLVLKGGQGQRKSRSLEALASPDWYCSSIPEAEKDLLLNIHSTWIYELAELESVTSRKEAGKLKNLITTSTDVLRVPYGRTSERMPRQSVLCATVNEDTFLRDDTGNRRFWVVPVDGAEQLDHAGLIAARDGIWKAAVLAHRAGEKPMLTPELEHQSKQQNERFNAQDPWAEMVVAWMNGDPLQRWDAERDPSTKSYDPNDPFTSAEVLYSAGLRRPDAITRADEMRVAAVLKHLGFKKGSQYRRDGQVVRAWVPSQPSQPSQPHSPEVVTPQNHCAAVNQDPLSQPSQPFFSKKGIDSSSQHQPNARPDAENDPLFRNVGCDTPPQPARSAAAQSVCPVTTSFPEVVTTVEVVTPPTPPAPAYDPFPPIEPSADLLAELMRVQRRMPGAIASQLAAAMDPDGERGITGRMVKQMQKHFEEMPDDFE
jgi:hypothetical protein